jgi:soluble lytic murein transglycosylase-like protein
MNPRLKRRQCLGAALALCWPLAARAGGQAEESLADSVRSALAAAVASAAPPKAVFARIEDRLDFQHWLAAMSERLQRVNGAPRPAKPDLLKSEAATRIEFLETLWYESKRAGLETAVVLALIQVESGFRKYAISLAGARGYMQVMPFWARLIGDGEPARLFHLQTNLRFGCVILRHYLDIERGDLFLALGRYNGSRGQSAYPMAVMANRQRWI